MTENDFVERWLPQTIGLMTMGRAEAQIILVGCFKNHSAQEFIEKARERAEMYLRRVYRDLVKSHAENNQPRPAKTKPAGPENAQPPPRTGQSTQGPRPNG